MSPRGGRVLEDLADEDETVVETKEAKELREATKAQIEERSRRESHLGRSQGGKRFLERIGKL